jgi:hypothetical protein
MKDNRYILFHDKLFSFLILSSLTKLWMEVMNVLSFYFWDTATNMAQTFYIMWIVGKTELVLIVQLAPIQKIYSFPLH